MLIATGYGAGNGCGVEMLRIAKALFSSDRLAGEDAIWRKKLISRLADARVDMWCKEGEERTTSVEPCSHFDPPLHSMTPFVSEEEPLDLSAWDRLDEQRHVMKLASAAALAADRRSRRIRLVVGASATSLTALTCGLAYLAHIDGGWTTIVSPSQPASQSAPKAPPRPMASLGQDKAERDYLHQYQGTANSAPQNSQKEQDSADTAAAEMAPRIALALKVTKGETGELALPIALSWQVQQLNTAVLLTGLPSAASILEGIRLPGGTWLLEAGRIDNLKIKDFPAEIKNVDLRLDLTRYPDNVICTVDLKLAVHTPVRERPSPSDLSRASFEKVINSARPATPARPEKDEETEKPQRRRVPAVERRETSAKEAYPNQSALGVGNPQSAIAPQISNAAAAFIRGTSKQPAWAIELREGGATR